MKLFIKKIIFVNRAPFDKIDIDFQENEIAVLTAVNGRGKTTILSHIVDALHEIARPYFGGEFEGRENKFYRVSSSIYSLDTAAPSMFYLRFNMDGVELDYIDIRGSVDQATYESYALPDNKIRFEKFSKRLIDQGFIKFSTVINDKAITNNLFRLNIATYFPAYRYESPGYLNDAYKIELDFTKESMYSGKLPNPIEVVTGVRKFANWLMDVVLDMQYDQSGVHVLKSNLDTLLTLALHSKGVGALRFGIGPRGFGGTRIQIIKTGAASDCLYPNIFNLSSGEASILFLFGEIIRQADIIKNNIPLNEVTGIVLIDEVDKHLHVRLQKEILPTLFNLFPNIQFVVSSHSPFLNIGLAEVAPGRAKIIDLDNFGLTKDPTKNELYDEVYQMMINENSRFKSLYEELNTKISTGNCALIITEGKTDIQHLKAAQRKLKLESIDIEYFEVAGDWGDSKLKLLLEQLSKIKQSRRIIGVFDRDVAPIVQEIERDSRPWKSYGNNVYAFCLPVPDNRASYQNISIEFYYSDADLKKQKDGRCLYFDNEVAFTQTASRKNERLPYVLEHPLAQDEYIKRIFDENIGSVDWGHSKARFADLIEKDNHFCADIDFSSFRPIFSKIEELIALE